MAVIRATRRVYRRDGLEGLFRRAVARPLERTVQFLDHRADLIGRLRDRLAAWSTSIDLVQRQRALLARNARFADCHKGRRAFVIGNGPSLATQDLSPLTGEITFVMSGFWKHPEIERWQPTYYCLFDPLFFDGSAAADAFLVEIRKRVTQSTFFFPLGAEQSGTVARILSGERTFYVATAGPWCRGWIGKTDLTKVTDTPQSVSQLALMAAIYMGCSPIYLLGLDHDELAHRGALRHFYRGLGGMEAHPHLRVSLSDYSYRDVIEPTLRLWRGYESLNAVARSRGIRIVNATAGGFLDVFERQPFEDVIGRPVTV